MAMKTPLRIAGGLGVLGSITCAIVGWRVADLGGIWAGASIASVLAVVAWIGLDRDAVSGVLRSRQARHSSGASLLVAASVAAAIALNVVAAQNDHRWDLTSTNRHALSAATLSVIERIEQPIQVDGFFSSGSTEETAFNDLIDRVLHETNQIQVAIHDPVRDPAIADNFAVDNSLGTVVLKMAGRTQRIDAEASEEALSNALIRLMSGGEHTICSTEGHGEIDPDDDLNPASFSAAVTILERQNYTVRPLNLARTGRVSEECSLLLIADPRTNFASAELEALDEHVLGGGQTLVLLDPGHSPNLATALANYGVDVGENLVLERHPQYQLMGGDESYLVVTEAQMTDHPITEPITGMILLRVARTVQALQPPMDDFDVGELFVTSDHAYAETRLDGTSPPKRDAEDPAGQLGLAAVSVHSSGGRTVVFGDSDFTSNELLDQASNFELLPNTVAWLVNDAQHISIRPSGLGGGFTMNAMQGILLWIASVVVVPGLALIGAAVTWMRRRNR